MSPKRQRLIFVFLSVCFLCTSALLMMNAFKENVVFFYSPSQLPHESQPGMKMRIGGLVEAGSVQHEENSGIRFVVTDNAASLPVHYRGALPNLFREGQGVVVEGALSAERQFEATRVLAKHDETYMPPEVAEALKSSGRWKGENK